MRAALGSDQFSILRYVHRSIACAVKAGDAPTLPHKADQSVQDRRVGEDLANDAIQEYGIIFKNIGIFQVIQVIAEGRLVSPRILSHFLYSEIGIGDRIVIVTSRRAQVHNQELSRRSRSYSRLARECGFNLLLDLSRNAVHAGGRD